MNGRKKPLALPGTATLALLITASACFGQGRVSEFLAVKSWQGTVSITGNGSGSTSGGPYSDVWKYSIVSNATIQLPTVNSNIEGWTGTFTGTVNVDASDVSSAGGCSQTFTQTGTVPLGASKTFTMHLQGDNQYVFYPSDYEAAGGTNSTTNSCVAGTLGGPSPITWAPVVGALVHNLPATGFSLTGSETVAMNSPMQPESEIFGGTPAVINVTVTWDFEPGNVSTLQVVVPSTTAYQNFRPTAGANGTRGNSIDLTAKLQNSDGTISTAQAAYFTWELTGSKEPGYAMNATLDSPSADFDLKMESGSPAFLTLDPTGQKAQTVIGQYTQSTVTIASYDWGGFGTIKVTAFMPDGEQIVGFLEGDTSQTAIRLPKRSDSSLIADIWKQNNGTLGKADISDDEDDPPGDGSPGDGLTLYEEYRGFIIGGTHVEGNPAKKDYFIVNTGGQSYQSGLVLFKNLSRLEVHYNLKQTEMPLSRVINPNHGQGAHIVDQHGIVINPFATSTGYAIAVGGPGTPKSVTMVNVPPFPPDASASDVSYMASSLAHELFHACNVYHHGDLDYPSVSWMRMLSGAVIENGTTPVTLLDELGGDASVHLPELTATTVNLGLMNDQHSGDDNCVMRYDNAHGYKPEAGPVDVRYYPPKESAGFGLCSQAEGTGINDPGHQPQPRYGNAASGRGNCAGQILVNDAVVAPSRR
jgi:hypothetical protein